MKKIKWGFKLTTKNIAVVAVLSALSFVLYMFVKFPLPFIFPSFLDMQFSDLPALLGGFSLGPIAGTIIIVVKCLLKLPFSSTACVGELADLLIGLAFVLPSSVYYRYNRNKKGAIISLLIGSFSAIIMAVVANRFILIPFFTKAYGMEAIVGMMKALYPEISADSVYKYYLPLAVLPFNFLRCLVCGVLTYFTYKPLSKALHWEENAKKKFLISKSPIDTERIAFNYARTLNKGDIVLLQGEMGAGKTAFVKGLALGLGIKEEVTSPTYAYLNVYEGLLYHYDLYRLDSGKRAEELGLTDYFGASDNICVLEWSENIKEVLPENCKQVIIEKKGNKRKITLWII